MNNNSILHNIEEEMNELEMKVMNNDNINNEYNEIKQRINKISFFNSLSVFSFILIFLHQ